MMCKNYSDHTELILSGKGSIYQNFSIQWDTYHEKKKKKEHGRAVIFQAGNSQNNSYSYTIVYRFVFFQIVCSFYSFPLRFGRKPALLASSLLSALLGTGSIFAPTFPIYCVIRFLLSMSMGTIYSTTLTLRKFDIFCLLLPNFVMFLAHL